MLYIIVNDNSQTYGIFTSHELAEAEIKNIYKNGYCGGLTISEDEIKE